MEEDLIRSKAILISGGAVRLPKGYRPPVRFSRSTAGPGAGERYLIFSFSGMRVKKTISEDGEFEFDPEKKQITRDGRIIANDVTIIPADIHCPEQAFFNLDQRCMFDCLFCSSPDLKVNATDSLDFEKMASMIRGCENPIHSIALTSGVNGSVKGSAEKMIDCVSYLRKEFPDMPIGVEPYVDDIELVDRFHKAGATEIKINIETATDSLFRTFCPSLDRNMIIDMLAHAVKVFGKGKVSSNIIVGLGESDDDMRNIMQKLCSMGVTPTVRGLRISDDVRENLQRNGIEEQPSPDRLITVSKIQKSLMDEYRLKNTFDTMCLRCTCCDLVPFIDL